MYESTLKKNLISNNQYLQLYNDLEHLNKKQLKSLEHILADNVTQQFQALLHSQTLKI